METSGLILQRLRGLKNRMAGKDKDNKILKCLILKRKSFNVETPLPDIFIDAAGWLSWSKKKGSGYR